MKKLSLIIIGIIIGIGLNTGSNTVYAADNTDTCDSTLYENEFSCKTVHSYCTTGAKALRTNQKYNLYESAYCNTTRDDEDEIYEIVADQLKVEDPKWDEDLVEFYLFGINTKSIGDFLKDTHGDKTQTDKLPDAVEKAYSKGTLSDNTKIYDIVKNSYEREKIMYQSKESLKKQFENREIWSNASLNDSPFDLVVDLNLIEIMLFGSKAKWTSESDVWSWPEDESKTAADTTTANNTTTTPPSTSGSGTSSSGSAPSSQSSSSPGDEYTCAPDTTTSGTGSNGSTTTSSPGVIPANCGNGKLDSGEECDDSNNKAGDGCSESCKKESGTNLQCKDTGGITFKTFTMKPAVNKTTTESGTTSATGSSSIPLNCPPGSKAVKKSDLVAESAKKVTQSTNYPGPDIGGILKKFPLSKKAECPPGNKPVTITVAGTKETRCMPSVMCGDFKAAKEFLFGKGYENDPTKKDAAAAIEISICMNVEMVKLPGSVYATNEGCIDCHIAAMNDIMKKMLEKNVAPLQNTTQAWGTSNRWGPTASFDVNILMGRLKNTIMKPKNIKETDKKLANKAVAQAKQDAALKLNPNQDSDDATPVATISTATLFTRWTEAREKEKMRVLESMENYNFVNEASADLDTHNSLVTLLTQLQSSFTNLRNKSIDLSLGSKINETPQCTF